MPHKEMTQSNYWYTDADLNALVKVYRAKKGLADGCDYLLKQKSCDGFHVVLLGVVNGQQGATVNSQNIEWHLNRKSRPLANSIFGKLLEFDSVPSMKQLTEVIASARVGDTKAAQIYNLFGNFEGDITAFKKVVEAEIIKESGTDLFDEIGPILKTGDSQFRILFPLNLGRFDTKADTGSHWVFGEIEIEREGNNVNVILRKHNSVGGGEFTTAELSQFAGPINCRLKEIFNDNGIKITIGARHSNAPKRQVGGSECGPITWDGIEARAEGNPIPKTVVPEGAGELRQQQYEMIAGKKAEAEMSVPKKTAASSNMFKSDDAAKVKKVFDQLFKDMPKAKLQTENHNYKIATSDLSEKSLREFAQKTAELVKQLGYTGPLEMNAPTEAKDILRKICGELKLNIKEAASPAKGPTT